MKTSFIVFCMAVFIAVTDRNAVAQLPEVAPVDFSRLKPSDFADDELDMPYFLAHLHEVANAVVQADRKAILAVLTRDDLCEHGREFTNQYSNVWPGGRDEIRAGPQAGCEG